MVAAVPLFAGLPGGPELLLVLLIAVALFGANKAPDLAETAGKVAGGVRKGREELTGASGDAGGSGDLESRTNDRDDSS